jgi:DNA-binding protein HU-beta
MTKKIDKAQLGKEFQTILADENIKVNAITSEKLVANLFETIKEHLANGEAVDIYRFGKFGVNERAARKGRNPKTGEELEIAAKKAPKFSPAKGLKDAVNN